MFEKMYLCKKNPSGILYQRKQNVWWKNAIYTLKVLPKLNETDYEMHYTSGKTGRWKLAFEDSSEKGKGRKSKELRKTVGIPDLTRVTKMSLRTAGKTDAVELFDESLETTPTRGSRIRKA